MPRVRWILDFADPVNWIRNSLLWRYDFSNETLETVSPWVLAAIRGLLVQEFYFLIIPDPDIPLIRKDEFRLREHLPNVVQNLHCQLSIVRDIRWYHEWVKVHLNANNDLLIDLDLNPRDLSMYFTNKRPYYTPLPRQR